MLYILILLCFFIVLIMMLITYSYIMTQLEEHSAKIDFLFEEYKRRLEGHREIPEDVDVIESRLNNVQEIVPFFTTSSVQNPQMLSANIELFVAERNGTVRVLSDIDEHNKVFKLPGIFTDNEAGLLGLALDPKFKENKCLYVYYTTITNGRIVNELASYKFTGNSLRNKSVLLTGVPASNQNNGGHIAFGQDCNLYLSTGDSNEPFLSQDLDSLAGKILKLTFSETQELTKEVYAYGLRNPESFAWDSDGNLWVTDCGPEGFDKIIKLTEKCNCGWASNTFEIIQPYLTSGSTSWRPVSLTIVDDVLYFSCLNTRSLAKLSLKDTSRNVKHNYYNTFGRIRGLCVVNKVMYFGTCNHDDLNVLQEDDDYVLMLEM